MERQEEIELRRGRGHPMPDLPSHAYSHTSPAVKKVIPDVLWIFLKDRKLFAKLQPL